jgi:hypothetical protein
MTPTAYVPAPPGFAVLRPDSSRAPILAWELEPVPVPVTLDGRQPGQPVLGPDGTVALPGVRTWPSEEAWRAELEQLLEAPRAMPRNPRPTPHHRSSR